VLAFSVSQRTNELGIRMALGAERGTILRMILGEGAAMALVGLVVGGVAAIPMSALLRGLLFGVEPADPTTIALSAVLLVGVALVAAWIPARRATVVDPITALCSDGTRLRISVATVEADAPAQTFPSRIAASRGTRARCVRGSIARCVNISASATERIR
jgi:predicted lysophospholipase L1 biosynthesis ABC-type transport system permease subunit